MTWLFGRCSVDDYSRSATWRGFASVMDLTGNTKRQHHLFETGEQADTAALFGDWQLIGDDLRASAHEVMKHR